MSDEPAPPRIGGAQSALRFALEMAALIGIGAFIAGLVPGRYGTLGGVAVALVVAAIWGGYAVPGDPSRSGRAPVAIRGWLRLVLELTVFVGGAAAMAAHGWLIAAGVMGAALIVHHAGTLPRLRWLLSR